MTANPTVYILDDDLAVRRSLTRLLKSGGYEPHAFASVADFLELKQFAPRARVIADIRIAGFFRKPVEKVTFEVNARQSHS